MTITKALQCDVSINSLTLSTFTNSEEGWTELVYKVNVDTFPMQALAFWDSLGAAVDRWKSRLPENLARLLTEQIAIHVNWP